MEERLPEGFVNRIESDLGVEQAHSLVNALQTHPVIGFRVNPLKNFNVADVMPDAEAVAWCQGGYRLKERPKFTFMPELHGGAFYVQDPSSMIHRYIVSLLADDAEAVLDLCAAPGGKTTAALSALPEDVVVVANEVVPSRAKILKENITKWGREDVIVTSAKSVRIAQSGAKFDIIIADVPCSGEGMMRKDSEARKQWSEGLVEQCCSLQRKIVDEIIQSLKPGGWLIYSTCTFNTIENEGNVKFFMEKYGLENHAIDIPQDWNIAQLRIEGIEALRFMPHISEGEGLFVALLRKPMDEEIFRTPRVLLPRQEKSVASGWVIEGQRIYKNGNKLEAMSDSSAAMAALLRKSGVSILSAGVEVGELKGMDLIPAQALALNHVLRKDVFPEVELEYERAIKYLRRDTLTLPDDTPKGFVIVKYRGVRLGWMKHIGNRSNNLYPKEWRILSSQYE
ncbi:MAG: rRNA cytosine-C5-methyltransferase [Prevotella sp.]|nr:rRNA cytosine-C5-methyltransferase [Bacteroides sp.]MCM1367137.1 rRNA cytosine-C5-methyltransferase [Prevotella sp.]MCM1437567.1 rRNA cytosine-C5-methyltransferase [Prevotella sp.]